MGWAAGLTGEVEDTLRSRHLKPENEVKPLNLFLCPSNPTLSNTALKTLRAVS